VNDLVPIIVAVIAFITALVTLLKGRKGEKANAAESITDSAAKLVAQYRERLEELEALAKKQTEQIKTQEARLNAQARQIKSQSKQIGILQQERAQFLTGVQSLCDQIKGLGHTPVWEPKEAWDDYRVDSAEERDQNGLSMG